jgi:hypothetical protein
MFSRTTWKENTKQDILNSHRESLERLQCSEFQEEEEEGERQKETERDRERPKASTSMEGLRDFRCLTVSAKWLLPWSDISSRSTLVSTT